MTSELYAYQRDDDSFRCLYIYIFFFQTFHTAQAGNEIVRNSTVANAKICFAKFYVTYFVVLLPVSSYCTLIVIFHVRFLVLNHPTYIR